MIPFDAPYRCPICEGVSSIELYETAGLDGVRCPRCFSITELVYPVTLIPLGLPERCEEGRLF